METWKAPQVLPGRPVAPSRITSAGRSDPLPTLRGPAPTHVHPRGRRQAPYLCSQALLLVVLAAQDSPKLIHGPAPGPQRPFSPAEKPGTGNSWGRPEVRVARFRHVGAALAASVAACACASGSAAGLCGPCGRGRGCVGYGVHVVLAARRPAGRKLSGKDAESRGLPRSGSAVAASDLRESGPRGAHSHCLLDEQTHERGSSRVSSKPRALGPRPGLRTRAPVPGLEV